MNSTCINKTRPLWDSHDMFAVAAKWLEIAEAHTDSSPDRSYYSEWSCTFSIANASDLRGFGTALWSKLHWEAKNIWNGRPSNRTSCSKTLIRYMVPAPLDNHNIRYDSVTLDKSPHRRLTEFVQLSDTPYRPYGNLRIWCQQCWLYVKETSTESKTVLKTSIAAARIPTALSTRQFCHREGG